MSDNLIERLRDHASHDPRRREASSSFLVVRIAPDLYEAANRIEQLETALNDCERLRVEQSAAALEARPDRDALVEWVRTYITMHLFRKPISQEDAEQIVDHILGEAG